MSGWDAARFGWLLACTLVASVTDVRERRIPNCLVLVCAAATPVWWSSGAVAWTGSLWGGVLVGGLFLVPAVVGSAGMGDAKLAAVLGFALGWQAAGPLLAGSAMGLLIGLAVQRRVPSVLGREDGFPLALAFLLGLVVVAVVSG